MSKDVVKGALSISEDEKSKALKEIHIRFLKGFTVREIKSWLRSEHPTLDRDTINSWVTGKLDEIREAAQSIEDDRPLNLQLAIDRCQYIYNEALRKGQLREAQTASDRICFLQGIDPRAPNNVTQILVQCDGTNSGKLAHMSDEELRKLSGGQATIHTTATKKLVTDE